MIYLIIWFACGIVAVMADMILTDKDEKLWIMAGVFVLGPVILVAAFGIFIATLFGWRPRE